MKCVERWLQERGQNAELRTGQAKNGALHLISRLPFLQVAKILISVFHTRVFSNLIRCH